MADTLLQWQKPVKCKLIRCYLTSVKPVAYSARMVTDTPGREVRDVATKRRYGRHREGRVPITFWVDWEVKEILLRDVKRAHLR